MRACVRACVRHLQWTHVALLPLPLLVQRLKGLNFDSILRFEQRNLAPESRLALRACFYAAFGTGTMPSGTVDLLRRVALLNHTRTTKKITRGH